MREIRPVFAFVRRVINWKITMEMRKLLWDIMYQDSAINEHQVLDQPDIRMGF